MMDTANNADNTNMDGSDGRLWYIIHTYSGYENKVKKNLEHRILTLDMSDHIFRVEVPTIEEIEIKGGQRHNVHARSSPATCWWRWSWTSVRGTSCATPLVSQAS